MSTQELAEKIGKSQATVSRIENGKQGVTLPLLMTIAKALNTTLVDLIEHESVTQSALKSYGFLMQTVLATGRTRAHLSLADAARESGIPQQRLECFEVGELLPTEAELERLCILYSIDAELARQVHFAEHQCPLLVSHLSKTNLLLADCLELLRQPQKADDEFRLSGLTRRIERCLADLSCERQGDYFSIGHISDHLMKALQDPAFHARAEELARQWRPSKGESQPANSPLHGSEDGQPSHPFPGSSGTRVEPRAVYYGQDSKGSARS